MNEALDLYVFMYVHVHSILFNGEEHMQRISGYEGRLALAVKLRKEK